MIKHKKKKAGVQIPELRKHTPPPPPPTSGSNAFKPSPVAVSPNNISTIEIMCHYETPCGWCCKWDKKCDKKIGRNAPLILKPKSNAQEFIDEVKSGKLPPIGSDSDFGLQTID